MRAASEGWKFSGPTRTQRRLPFTACPIPGTSTTTSRPKATSSSAVPFFSQNSTGSFVITKAGPRRQAGNFWRSR